MDAFQSALKTGVKLQEESTQRYLDLLGQAESPNMLGLTGGRASAGRLLELRCPAWP